MAAMKMVMQFTDTAIVANAMTCVRKNMDRSATIDEMRKSLGPDLGHKAPEFVNEVYNEIERKQTTNKRKAIEAEIPEAKKAKTVDSHLTNDQIKIMMETVKKEIAEKAARAKKLKLERLKAKIGDNLAKVGMGNALDATQIILQNMAKPPEPKENNTPKPLILDDEGRTIDSSGQLIHLQSRVPTLKANIRAKKQEEFRQKLQQDSQPSASDEVASHGGNMYVDPRIKSASATRSKRSFKFHEAGKYVKQAKKIRTKAQLDKLNAEIALGAKRTGIEQASKLASIVPKICTSEDMKETPDIEWWDAYVYNQDENTGKLAINMEAITMLIEHPIQMEAPGAGSKGTTVLKTYLTKKERKKIRRMNRKEALKDDQEKQRLGLAPPPEPKVKLSNLMRVLGTEAVRDPTKVEQHVRMQMEKRKRAHEHANAARKLTDEQRKEKKMKKLKEDTSDGVHVVVYKLRTMRDPAKKFKVEKNSNQLYMTGCTLLHPDLNVVVVEGGPNAQRKYERLMMHRIKWEEDKKGKKHEGNLIRKINDFG